MGSHLSNLTGLMPLSQFPENTASGPLRMFEAGPSIDWWAVMKSERGLGACPKPEPRDYSAAALALPRERSRLSQADGLTLPAYRSQDLARPHHFNFHS